MGQTQGAPGKRAVFRPSEIWRGVHATAKSDAFGGVLLLVATAAALIMANSSLSNAYFTIRDFKFGIPALHLYLSVGAWAADGLLAIFFFVVGLELKEEFRVGTLRDPRKAALPIAATIGGVIAPALIFVLLNLQNGTGMRGWAIPTATDIAFAVSVLAVVGKHLPSAVRVFLLTLAVVDDLIAIIVIAFVYTERVEFIWLAAALVPFAVFAYLVQRGVRSAWLLVPLAVLVWAGVHASGIHATVAGVLLGFAVPVEALPRTRVRVGTTADGAPVYEGMAPYLADRWGLFATVVAVPIFAFFSAGVDFGGLDGIAGSLTQPVTLGVLLGLLIGKPLGIVTASFLVTRFPGVSLGPLKWSDVTGIGFVAGIGFTVSLLVAELAFGLGSELNSEAKVGVLLGSLASAIIGATILGLRSRRNRLAAG